MVNLFTNKNGFGIVEVLIAAAVLGFMCVALNRLQLGNHDAFLRIRGRDGAVEVAQQVLDSLRSVGVASIPSNPTNNTVFTVSEVSKSWERGLGGKVTVVYTPVVTVSPTGDYTVESTSSFEAPQHVYAKQVNVSVSWSFKNSTQSVNVSGVVR